MRTIILALLALTSFEIQQAKSQTVYGSPVAESTITGIQYGGGVGYQAKKGFMAGVFYQAGKNQTDAWSAAQTEFYGVETFLPLARSKKVSFSAHLRAGMCNKLFFVFVPGAETIIHINKNIAIGSGLGWRYGHAAIEGRLFFKM